MFVLLQDRHKSKVHRKVRKKNLSLVYANDTVLRGVCLTSSVRVRNAPINLIPGAVREVAPTNGPCTCFKICSNREDYLAFNVTQKAWCQPLFSFSKNGAHCLLALKCDVPVLFKVACFADQAPVVQRADNFIHWIAAGKRYPSFEQPE